MLRPLLGSYVAVATEERVVAFTFDDGPDPDRTPGVLDVLRSHGATASFFVVGERAAQHPELVRRTIAEGHEVCLHGHTHTALPELSTRAQAAQLARGRRALAAVSGAAPRFFRAPYGRQAARTVVLARLLRMRPIMWSAYAGEWSDQPLAACVAQAEPGIRAGGIVLLHDGSAGRDQRSRRPAEEIEQLLAELLTVAADRGLDAVSVGQLLRRGRPRRRLWFRSWRM